MATGEYEGKAVMELLDDGRRVRLDQPFTYIDPEAARCDVPNSLR